MAPKVVSLTPAVFHLSDAVNEVSRTYGQAPIVPRGPRLAPLIGKVRDGIRAALGCPSHEAVLMTGTGSTAMAAVLGSCLAPDERLLVIRNGAYGDRLVEYATTLRQPLVDMSLPYGQRPNLDEVEQLAAANAFDAVAMVYGGTSTCTLNPVAEVGAIARRYGKKYFVDGVSSLFIEPMDLDGWGVSAVMGSCNKGLHSHPNLTMCLVQGDLLAAMDIALNAQLIPGASKRIMRDWTNGIDSSKRQLKKLVDDLGDVRVNGTDKAARSRARGQRKSILEDIRGILKGKFGEGITARWLNENRIPGEAQINIELERIKIEQMKDK